MLQEEGAASHMQVQEFADDLGCGCVDDGNIGILVASCICVDVPLIGKNIVLASLGILQGIASS